MVKYGGAQIAWEGGKYSLVYSQIVKNREEDSDLCEGCGWRLEKVKEMSVRASMMAGLVWGPS